MKEADLKIKYKIQSRADLLVKDDTVKALAQSGCDEVWIGAESGSQKILDAMDKGTSVAQIEESTELMKTHGIKPCFFLQFGYLGEKYADVMKTIQLLQKLKPHDIGVSVSYPLPGTKFYEKVKHELNQKANWADSDELLLMYKGEYPPEFYKRLHRYVHRKFRASKAWESITKKEGSFKLKLSFALHKPLEAWTYLQMKKSLKAS
jgi:anaerobic magnesium-protoporphyrin IX monomethyl ester cyclase